MIIKAFCMISKALSDETRVRIVKRLAQEEMCACKLLDIVDCGQSTLSHHMKTLISSGIVIVTEVGKWRYYALNLDLLKDFISEQQKIYDCRPEGE